MAEELNKKRAAVLYIDDSYGNDLRTEFSNHLVNQYGGEIVAEEKYSPLLDLEVFDLRDRLARLAENEPEVLYLISTNKDLLWIGKQMKSVDFFKSGRMKLVITDAAKGEELLANSIFDGAYGIFPSNARNAELKEKYSNKYGEELTYAEVADVYDIVYLYALGLLKASTENAIDVSKMFERITNGGKELTASEFKTMQKFIKKGKGFQFSGLLWKFGF